MKLVWANKGELVAHLEGAGPRPSFRLAIGDDRTDEDLFERLPAGRVDGPRGRRVPRWRGSAFPTVRAVLRLLEELAALK